MPEGPEIRRAADRLVAAVVGKTLTGVWFAFPELKPYEATLMGEKVERIVTRGKALLTWFSNDVVMYSHNRCTGSGVWENSRPIPAGSCESGWIPPIMPFRSTAPLISLC